MKIKYLWWILPCLLIMAAAVSCKSTPAEPEVPPPPPPVEEPAPPPPAPLVEQPAPPPPVQDDSAALEALAAAEARAEAARQLVMDFDGQSSFPSEWQAADALFAEAGQEKRTGSSQEIQDSITRFDSAADAFEAMTAQTLARYFENMEREITSARNAAVAAGALTTSPDMLLEADYAATDAYNKFLENEFYTARDTVRSALAMYGAIETGLRAYAVRQEIAESAGELATEALQEADAAFTALFEKWDAGDFTAARDSAAVVLVMYLQTAALTERERALSFRADVAARSDFSPAQALFTRANTAFGAQNLEEAGSLFTESRPMFAEAARLAQERQLTAEEALRLANERMAESNEIAINAERILEGGEE